MSGFEDFSRQAQNLEREIVRWGVVLGIDWDDPAAVAALAREAVAFRPEGHIFPADPAQRARVELFGLVNLMLTVMAQSAEQGIHTHGGPVWKTFARALYAATENRRIER